MNPAYVFLGLLIAFVLMRMWSLTVDDPSGGAPSDSTPAHGVRERVSQAFLRAVAVVVAPVAGFVIYIAPEIALNKMVEQFRAQGSPECPP